MPGLSDAALVALIDRHQDLTDGVRRRVLEYVGTQWDRLRSWREADIEAFVAAILPIVTGGQLQVANLTAAYLATLERAATGAPANPVGVSRSMVTDLRGVAAAEVYRRAGPAVWTALSQDKPLAVAARMGRERALVMVETDLQLAETRTAQVAVAGSTRTVGYRRKLTGRESCGVCAVASTQRYRKAELLPIHARCDCKVVPIYGDRDPGRVLNRDVLDSLKGELTERFGTAYSDRNDKGVTSLKSLVVTHQNGELGPVLARRGDHFTGPSDL